ncbi:hypothetical protein [Paracoccus sediminicola]|uniref:hypothetical protein n=1 Tax=Paracoccus sediminicola TaxID=3017783 RepID=UPI0022EFE45B|nr:hypothetical protein [Paracoccus sediminicola]WBU55572.1 hypothetical protein PAF18_08505 [Paracoccus sediminicola]
MTADLNTKEFMLFSDETQSRGLEMNTQRRSLPVFHEYGRIEIADGDAFESAPAGSAPAATPEADLSLTETLGQRAFQRRNSENMQAAKANRPHQGLSWEGSGNGGPAPLHPDGAAWTQPVDPGLFRAPSPDAQAPLSARLTGRVALGLVIVSGTDPRLQFSTEDQTLVVSEVQNGLSFLANEAPRKDVTFVHDISVLTVNAPEAGPEARHFDDFEAPWRDAALAQLGHGPGIAGCDALARALRDRHGTDWAYIAFFTKYRLWHFAYAGLGGPRLVMHFDNDGWGPDQIDRVFAHETGHIFNAPDEYAQSNCDCGGAWGYFAEPNANCAACAPGGGVKCIMQSNDWAMCDHTRLHLGYEGLPGRPQALTS